MSFGQLIYIAVLGLFFLSPALGKVAASDDVAASAQQCRMTLRSQVPLTRAEDGWKPVFETETWDLPETAVIVCDMWDSHHCYNAAQRVKDMAPRVNQYLNKARSMGALIIHSPSSCMSAYKEHPARRRAIDAPLAENLPKGIEKQCKRIPAEEGAIYPIDESSPDGEDGEDVHRRWQETLRQMGRKPGKPWVRQIDTIEIHDEDAISDDGAEVWNLLEDRGIKNVILVGVHANRCVLHRPFGLRQMVKNGKHAVLVRDLTDTMYDPARWPYVSHHTGTDFIVEYIEKFICPSVQSSELLGGKPFRFYDDHRPLLAVVISEFEYETYRTLPPFVRQQLASDFQVEYLINENVDQQTLPGIKLLNRADVALLSLWRRALPAEELQILRRFVSAGKPVVAIRTASHGLTFRKGTPPEGHTQWPDFDQVVLGGHYLGHYGKPKKSGAPTHIWIAQQQTPHPVIKGLEIQEFESQGSLYKFEPLADSTTPVLFGRVGTDDSRREPVAWTNVTLSGGRSFYTSLGDPDDFDNSPPFHLVLRNAVYWAAERPIPGRIAHVHESFR